MADKTVYLLPACFYPEELAEVVEDFYEEIFRQELQARQPDEAYWPDTAHFGLFNRWFRVDINPQKSSNLHRANRLR